MPPVDHRAQPLAHVALVQSGGSGDLLGRRRGQGGHRVEQTRAVADADHQCERSSVQNAEQLFGESFG